jgi:elongation factor G
MTVPTTTIQTTPIQRLRNIGIAAHIDAGKTTTTERMLFVTGRIHRTGEVHDGQSVTDYLDVEKRRGITVTAAATSVVWQRFGQDHPITIIDTPGHIDFGLEVERAMRVLDGAVAVFDASQGVEPQSETVWRQADRYGVPRIAFVNKMDKVGADFAFVLADMEKKLAARVAMLQQPWFIDEHFVGIFDVIEQMAYRYRDAGFETLSVPENAQTTLLLARQNLVALAAEFDDALLAAFVGDQSISNQQLRAALRQATIAGAIVPVLCGASLANIGIEMLLDAVVDYLPAPPEAKAASGSDADGNTVTLTGTGEAPVVAFVFKVISDPYIGRLAFVRVYQGRLAGGMSVQNASSNKRERISSLVKLHANQHQAVDSLSAGEIGAIIGGKTLATGDTLLAAGGPWLQLERFVVPMRVMALAIEPMQRGDQERLGSALGKLVGEDPSLEWRVDRESGEQVLAGMGELHLEVAIERLRDEHGLVVRANRPRIAYRETIARAVELEVSHVKQQGGNGQFAKAKFRAEPLSRDQGFRFLDAVSGGALPKAFINAFRAGFEAALGSGLSGYPVSDLQLTLLDGAVHSQDSSEIAFQAAGSQAVRLMLEASGSVLLEPVMQLFVSTPSDFVGGVIGDLNGRRGQIKQLEARGNGQIIEASVPLQRLFGYVNDLRSKTQGRASFTMRLLGYEVKP